MYKSFFVLTTILLLSFAATSQPVGYYNGTEGLKGEELKLKLHEIIRDHTSLSYYFSKHILYYSDADPLVPGNVKLVYTGRSHDGMDYGSGGDKINREHVWAKSHGNFSGVLPMDSDVHNLKPADASVNSSRSNLDFDWSLYQHPEATECKYTPGVSWEPRNAVKGDIARIIFYMDARYKGTNGERNLMVVDQLDTYPNPWHGKLSSLLEWSSLDTPDQFERNRNDVIYGFQKNRNPFIDNPEFVHLIWGDTELPVHKIGSITISDQQPSDTDEPQITAIIDPRPASGNVKIFYGSSFNYLLDELEMDYNGNRWVGNLPTRPEKSVVYFVIRVVDAQGNTTFSPVYSYRVAGSFQEDIVPIPDIQGTGDFSPYDNQMLSTTGVVTAFFTNGYFIQDGFGPRTGLFVYDPDRYPSIGDSLVITGLVKEHFGLTEIVDVTAFELIKTDREVPPPAVISAADIGEDWESVLIRLENATCTFREHWNNFDMWRVNDGTAEANVRNNDVMSFSPALNNNYTVTGILNYDYSEFKIELRTFTDILTPTSVAERPHSIKFSVYPNPADDLLTINIASSNSEMAQFVLTDFMGRVVWQEDILLHPENNTVKFSVNDLPVGVYLLKIRKEQKVGYQKIIVK
jgi:endonuclease I